MRRCRASRWARRGVLLVLMMPWSLAVALGARRVILPSIGAVAERFAWLLDTNALLPDDAGQPGAGQSRASCWR